MSIRPFLSAFKNLQIIVHIMLIDLFTVAHCEIFFEYILMATNLQVYDLSTYMAKYLPVVKNEAMNLHFE